MKAFNVLLDDLSEVNTVVFIVNIESTLVVITYTLNYLVVLNFEFL